ncbi:hypothetical protein B296_00018288 [Ensete ventricosum]|uniref:Uncharacterized protein n=1 Tax=Ensete ventricosum TaxID=4639 RepID=A0A427ANA3_ENSVE|nr:hypothetical protein B296_00018288 [Ensete ventricosum]
MWLNWWYMAFAAVAGGGSRLLFDLLLNKSTSANQERAKETHKAVSDSIVVNHPGASEGLKELLLRSLHSCFVPTRRSRPGVEFVDTGRDPVNWLSARSSQYSGPLRPPLYDKSLHTVFFRLVCVVEF